MDWMNAALLGLWVATIGQVAFVVIYGVATPWRSGFVGRALFTKSLALAITLAVTLLNSYVVYAYQLQVGTVLMWLIALAIGYQLAALVRQRREARHARAGG